MENIRNLLLGALLLVSFLLWTAWQKEHAATAAVNSDVPAITATNGLPQLPGTVLTPAIKQPVILADQTLQVKTDVLNVTIDKTGGNIVNVSLPAYHKTLNSPEPTVLLNSNPNTLYIAQSGLVSNAGPDNLQQQAQYSVTASEYTLAPDQKALTVTLAWQNPQGLKVYKHFTFEKGSYLVRVTYDIDNKSKQAWSGYFYTQLMRKDVPQEKKSFFQINPFIGAVISSPQKRFNKLSFEDMHKKDFHQEIKDGWAAMLEHYFLSAWIPDDKLNYNYSTRSMGNDLYLVRMVGPVTEVAPGSKLSTSAKFYAGPAVAETLKAIAPGLDLTVDYGMLWFIATGIFWLMKQLHNLLGNWGWSIVLVTVIIKLLFYRLSAASYKSMAAMRKLQPRMMALKERYGDDKQKLSQATMELYRSEKINPLGGCLPVLVQIPVFIALYWVLLESVELRQAPFMLWIKDLSAPDPFYVLPVIMGISLFVQQKLNPTAMIDPIQAKVMMLLPVLFTVMFLNFPAGLVLYWVVNNVLSIIQQWYIMRSYAQIDVPKRLNHKK